MNPLLFKSLPNRDKLLFALAFILDKTNAKKTLARDSRHSDLYKKLLDQFNEIPENLSKVIVLSYLSDALDDVRATHNDK